MDMALGKIRLKYIDGLRGVAILLVLFFHAYIRWSDLYPYGKAFSNKYLLNVGSAGVFLFFIISGYVILKSLERTKTFFEFLFHRWLRLFPAMLACSIFVLATAFLFKERPRGDIGLYDLLPGITLLGDKGWRLLTYGLPVHPISIEAAFWSLYTEVIFYAIFGALYYWIGERKAIIGLAVIWILATIYSVAEKSGHSVHVITFMLAQSHFEVYSWFLCGCLYYLYDKDKNDKLYYAALAISILVSFYHLKTNLLPCLFISGLAGLTLKFDRVKQFMSNPVLIFFAFISYPLYLIHENIMVASIVKIGRMFPRAPALLVPVLPIALVVTLAFVFAKYVEPYTKQLILYLVRVGAGIGRAAVTTQAVLSPSDPAPGAPLSDQTPAESLSRTNS